MTEDKTLIVDDEAGIRFGVRDFLESQGYEGAEADSCQGMLEACQASQPDAVIADYLLPDGHALDLLPRVKDIAPTVPLIIPTAYGPIDLAVRAVKEGAEDFLTKPVELQALLVILRQLANQSRRSRESMLASLSGIA